MNAIILIGFMGSGKTTLGLELSRHYNIPFFDTDQLIEQNEGATISQIFLEKGEQYFREKEIEIIHSINFSEFSIIATGGGMPCNDGVMDFLNQSGTTIYLKTSIETLFRRLTADMEDRPLLEGMGEFELKMYIEDKLKEREAVYLKSKIILDENEHSVENVIRHLPQRS